MKYIDMHCDTLAEALVRGKQTAFSLNGTMLDVSRLQKSGAKAQFFAMFLPQRNQPDWFGLETMPDLSELMQMMYQIYQNTMDECKDIIAPARSYEELKRNEAAGKISAFLTIENGYPILGKMENIRQYYDMGARLITLTWNDANCLGYEHSMNAEKMKLGLTDFGKEAAAYMSELGILVDVSHLSDGGFYDVADIVKKPFVASHSNCRALSPATRNLTDDMIKVLANHGGVAGINFAAAFLNEDISEETSRVERMCDHIEHFIHIGGEDCVGIGTDFDGIGGKLEISDCTKMHLLFEALQHRGISEYVIDKIACKNVERVIKEGMR